MPKSGTKQRALVATTALLMVVVACGSLSATAGAAPTVSTTNNATLVAATTATLNGTVNPSGSPTTYRFEYGTTAALGTIVPAQPQELPPDTADHAVSFNLSGLLPATTYHFRVFSSNQGCGGPCATVNGAILTFTTTALQPPIVITGAASDVLTDSATLNGTINNRNIEATYHFEYGTTASLGTSTSTETLAAGAAAQPVAAALTNLDPATTYHVKLVATTTDGTTEGTTATFITAALPAVVSTTPATNILTSSATINGTVNSRGVPASYHFEYGLTPALGTPTTTQALGASGLTQPVSASLMLLSPGTKYYFKLVATTSAGTQEGVTSDFTTTPLAPIVTDDPAANIGATTARFDGTVDNRNFAATYHFEYGTTPALGTWTQDTNLAAGVGPQAVTANVTGLSPGTTYYFALVATTSGGTTAATTRNFTTLVSPPLVTTGPMQSIGGTTATVGGRINTNGVAATYHFEYGTTAALGTSTSNATLGAGAGNRSVTGVLAPLAEATTYFVRLVATTTGGTVQGATISFKTIDPPAVTTLAATNVTASTATLKGTIDTKGNTGTYSFHYATTTPPLSPSTPNATLAAGTGVRPVEVNITGLTPDTTYFVRLSAFTNGCGGFCADVFGAVLSFKTAAAPAVVVTTAATNVAVSTATLNGTIDNANAATTYHFEYGTTTALGTSTPNAALAAGTGAKPVSANVTGLSQATTYYFALVATTANGTSRGAVKTLDTSFEPPPKPKEFFVSIDSPSVPEGLARQTWTGQNEYVCRDVYNRNVGRTERVCDFTGPKIYRYTPTLTQLVFTFKLSAPSTETIVVKAKTSPGSAKPNDGSPLNTPTPTSDYGPLNPGAVTFAPGQTVAVLPVTVYGDNVVEGDESVVVSGEIARGTAKTLNVGTGTIINDDGTPSSAMPKLQDGIPLITSGPGSALENGVAGAPTSNVIQIPVRLSFPAKTDQTIPLVWTDGTALKRPPDGNGTDYWFSKQVPGTSTADAIVFKPGETLKVVNAQIYPDYDVEPDETFTIFSAGATGAATILNDDPSLSPEQTAQNEKIHTEILESLYKSDDATYQFDADGNGTWETQCDGSSAVVKYPSTATISAGVASVLAKLGVKAPATARAAASTPSTYSFAARAVTTTDDGETAELGHVTRDKIAASHVTVDKAYLLARLAEARTRLRARLRELRRHKSPAKPRGLLAYVAQNTATSGYSAALQKEIEKQIAILLKASSTVNNPGPSSAAVTAAIKAAADAQANTAITAACTEAQLNECPTTLIYKYVEMAFPSDAPAGSCFRRVAASTPTSSNLAAATSLQYRSPLNVAILVNGLRLQNGSLPVVDEKVDEKISHVRFVLDTGSNTLTSVSETAGLPPFAGIYGEIKPASASMGSRYILQTDLINWPVDRASKVTDASALKKAIANLPTNPQKLGWASKYGAGVNVAMSLGGLALNGIDEVHLLRKRSAAFGSFMLPTLARPTDKELADPTRKKGALELLQGVTVQTVFSIDNTAGIVFDGLNAKVAEIPAGNLFKIKDLNLSYTKSSDEWKGSLELFFPPTGAFGAKGSFTIRGGKFVGLSAAALFDPGIQLGCCIRLTKVGGSYANTYWDADGCLQSPATCSKYKSDHAGTLPPNLCLADASRKECETSVQVAGLVGLAAGPKLKIGAETKDLLNVDGSLKYVDSTANNPWALTANADFSLLGELQFGNAVITYINGKQFSAYGAVDKTFSKACLELKINAMLGVDIFSLTKWQAFAGVGIGGNLCGVLSFSFKQEVLASSRGIGACATVAASGYTYGSGVVYTWGDRSLHVFSGCSHDTLVAEGGVTATRAIRAQGAPRTVAVPAGLPTYLFKLTGATKPPDVVLTSPDGKSVDTTVAPGAPGFLVYRGVDNETYIDVNKPAAGNWKVTVKDGSSPVTGLDTANGIPDPSVKATVGGKGRARVLQYKARVIPGQRIRFAERLPGKDGVPGAAQIIGETTAGTGTLRFTSATGPAGKRTIEATVLQDDQPRGLLKVATYTAPGPFKPAAPKLRLRRKGSQLIVTWNRVTGASRYRVLARVTAFDNHVLRLVGRSIFRTRSNGRRSLVLTKISRSERVGVSVTAVSGAGLLGKTAHRSVGG
jgi:hypothetical protein